MNSAGSGDGVEKKKGCSKEQKSIGCCLSDPDRHWGQGNFLNR
jgi:hypothetical protein